MASYRVLTGTLVCFISGSADNHSNDDDNDGGPKVNKDALLFVSQLLSFPSLLGGTKRGVIPLGTLEKPLSKSCLSGLFRMCFDVFLMDALMCYVFCFWVLGMFLDNLDALVCCHWK